MARKKSLIELDDAMKVLQLNSVCGFGSTGRIMIDLHEALVMKGFQSRVAYGRESKNMPEAVRIGNRFDNYLHVLATRLFDNHCFASKNATIKFLKFIDNYKPELVHIHNLHGYYIHIGLLLEYFSKLKIPIVITLHDCWAFTGHCAYFDSVGCEKWKVGCYQCPLSQQYPKSWLFDRSKLNFSLKKMLFSKLKKVFVVCPSKWLANLVNQSFLNDFSVSTINNGIDLSTFRPICNDFRKRHNLNDQFLILGVSSVWSERKGFDYFLKISQNLEANEKIVLVGLNKKQIESLPPQILGIFKTNNIQELAEIYSACDVFVNPTLEDNFPTTNLESLACGTPVVTFNSGGSSESLDETCGIVIPRDNIEMLMEGIRRVKELGKGKFSRECRFRAEKNYNKNDRINDYISLYKRVLQNCQ